MICWYCIPNIQLLLHKLQYVFNHNYFFRTKLSIWKWLKISFGYSLPCWSTGRNQMKPRRSRHQGWPPRRRSLPAKWPAVHPGTQSLRGHWTRAGRRASSLYQRSCRHTCQRSASFVSKIQTSPIHLNFGDLECWPAVSVVTPAVSVAHVRTLLANINVI